MAAFVLLQQKERVIGVYASPTAKPANAAVCNELMYPALNVDTEGVARKPRSPLELSIRAVQQLEIVGVRIQQGPQLSINDLGEDLLARCVNNNFVVSERVRLLRVKAIRPTYVMKALCSVSVESKSLAGRLRWRPLSAPRSDGSYHDKA